MQKKHKTHKNAQNLTKTIKNKHEEKQKKQSLLENATQQKPPLCSNAVATSRRTHTALRQMWISRPSR
jgi:hypothetical protein